MGDAKSGQDGRTPAEERERRVSQVLAALYLLSAGDLCARVMRPDLERESRLGSTEFFDAFNFGEQTNLYESANFSHAKISYEGVLRQEAKLRSLLQGGGRELVRSAGIEPHLLLWQRLEYERFIFLSRLYELCGARLRTWVDHRKLQRLELGFGDPEVDRTYYFLSAGGMLDTSSNLGLVGLTVSGIQETEKLISFLQRAGKVEPTQDEFFEVLQADWQAAEGSSSGPIVRELPGEYFMDDDGTWLTAKWMRSRYGIPKSRLKEWREVSCPPLGRRLTARLEPGKGFVYLRMDVHELSTRRGDISKEDRAIERLQRLRSSIDASISGDSSDE